HRTPPASAAASRAHSPTMFLPGPPDPVGGTAVAASAEQLEWLSFVQNASGAILSPLDSWLVLRGIKTLAVRMERHEANGREIARYLAADKRIRKGFYPGLPDHPGHDLAKKQMRGFGAMISFETGSFEAASKLLAA